MKLYKINTKVYMQRYFLMIAGIMIVLSSSCKKFVIIDPPIDQLNNVLIFDNDKTATASIIGIYSNMLATQGQVENGALTLYAGLCADELYYYTPEVYDGYVLNSISLNDQQTIGSNFWTPLYKYIYTANACIQGLNISTKVSPKVKKELVGEAKLVRALCYYQLANLFGDVPLITGTDYEENSSKGRSSLNSIYNQIISDLKAASDSLPAEHVNVERTRPSRYSALALLARTYLYIKDWPNAIEAANEVISSKKYDLVNTPVTDVFLNNSKETIWQLKPVNIARNTYEAFQIIPASTSAVPTFLVTSTLYNAFEEKDKRKETWIASRIFNGQTVFYPFKYKVRGGTGIPQTEYTILFRLAEQYLIRSEANAQINNLSAAISDLDVIRKRGGLSLLSQTNSLISQSDLLEVIYHERQVELFAEWGHRWFDLKRTGKSNSVLAVLKPTWKASAVLWPIPSVEIQSNPNLMPQNAGY